MKRLLAWIVPQYPIWVLDDNHAPLFAFARIIDVSEHWLR